jgi:anti-sigma factor RsiW
MKLTCKELVGLLLDFLDEDLSPAQKARIEDHLCGCPPCHAYVESYRLTVHIAHRLRAAPAELPPHLADRLRNVMATLTPPPARA